MGHNSTKDKCSSENKQYCSAAFLDISRPNFAHDSGHTLVRVEYGYLKAWSSTAS
jgi:hypothetical protein